MSAGLFRLPLSTSYTVEQALAAAQQENLQDVIVLGYSDDGSLFICSSRMTCAEAAFLARKVEAWAQSGGKSDF